MHTECTNCGKCCTQLGGNIQATADDLNRWEKEKRYDILKYAYVFDFGLRFADLWISPVTGAELHRCPFIRKVKGSNKVKCEIYETRPQVCRDYQPWQPGSLCEIV